MGQGLIQRLLIYIFGANYRTSLFGIIEKFAIAVYITPTVISFLPDETEKIVQGIAGMIYIVFGLANSFSAKDKQVIGAGVDAEVTK